VHLLGEKGFRVLGLRVVEFRVFTVLRVLGLRVVGFRVLVIRILRFKV
jgi:hypothetical protein